MVYMDTSALNAVYDKFRLGRIGARSLRAFEFLVTSCQLDEILRSDLRRAADLAQFLWRYSNRQKLLDHVEIHACELEAAFMGRSLTKADYLDPTDIGFRVAWNAVRRGQTPGVVKAEADDGIESAKSDFRDGLRERRAMFARAAAIGPCIGSVSSWRKVLRELRTEGWIGELIWKSLAEDPLTRVGERFDRGAVVAIDYRELPCTAVGLEYYLALQYLAALGTGDVARPERGDQVDFRHAYYAGLSDVFVTSDRRMRLILSDYVQADRAEILDVDACLALIRRSPDR